MKNTLRAAVLLIGNELLSGRIQDKNLSHIAATLEQRGIRVLETRIIADIELEIVDAVNQLRVKYDYVFTTGGIGPTHDDITSQSIAKAFGVDNVVQPDAFAVLNNYFKKKGYEFTAAAQRMTCAPHGANLIRNEISIAPGYFIDNVFVMAGVPSIMQHILDAALHHLKSGSPILSGAVHADTAESEIADALHSIQQQHLDVDIGSYPQMPDSKLTNYRVIFVVRGTEQDEINTVCQQIEAACRALGKEAILA